MNNQSELMANYKSTAGQLLSWLFGILFFAIGIINIFWGNDALFGVFIVILSAIYFLPLNAIIKKMTRKSFNYPVIIKIVLGIFILRASLGVAELFDKIYLMMQYLNIPQ